jgi:hypothetical protein
MCTVLPGYIRNQGPGLLKDCVDCTLNGNPEFITQSTIMDSFLCRMSS